MSTLVLNTSAELFNTLFVLEDESTKDLNTFADDIVQPIIKRPNIGTPGRLKQDFAPLYEISYRVLLRHDKIMIVCEISIVPLKEKTIFTHLTKFFDLKDVVD